MNQGENVLLAWLRNRAANLIELSCMERLELIVKAVFLYLYHCR